jgi:hypothetical protein
MMCMYPRLIYMLLFFCRSIGASQSIDNNRHRAIRQRGNPWNRLTLKYRRRDTKDTRYKHYL